MKIVVLGAGALGSLFGGLLSERNEVVLIGRKPHMDEISANGLRITGITNKIVYPNTATAYEKSFEPELLIVTVKSYDTGKALASLPGLSKGTLVLSLQNGLGNIEAITSFVPERLVVAGLTSHGATSVGPGHINHGGLGETIIGRVSGENNSAISKIASVFNEAGIQIRVSDNMTGEIWTKAIVNSAINPLTAIHGIKNGQLLERPDLKDMMRFIVEEGIAVAEASNVNLPGRDIFARTLEVARMTADNKSSMLQDIEKGRMTEIESINGMVVKMGALAGVKTPYNAELTERVRRLQEK